MTWRVDLDRRAERELKSLPDSVIARIVTKLQTLPEEPFPAGVKRLQGHTGYRLRVGDYRILYEAFPKEHRIVIYAIGHRRDVYR